MHLLPAAAVGAPSLVVRRAIEDGLVKGWVAGELDGAVGCSYAIYSTFFIFIAKCVSHVPHAELN